MHPSSRDLSELPAFRILDSDPTIPASVAQGIQTVGSVVASRTTTQPGEESGEANAGLPKEPNSLVVSRLFSFSRSHGESGEWLFKGKQYVFQLHTSVLMLLIFLDRLCELG